MIGILTAPTREIIRGYDVNFNYINTKTFKDDNNVSLKFLDDVVDNVGNETEQQDESGDQNS